MWSNVNSQDHTEEDSFMIAKGVTQEEIEEFHRLSMISHFYSKIYVMLILILLSFTDGFIPTDNQAEGQGRSFGKIGEALKFWNWHAFDSFRHWIEERRTTTIKPIPVYIVNNPDESYSFNDIYVSSARPPYFM
jgi:hypothetical protein